MKVSGKIAIILLMTLLLIPFLNVGLSSVLAQAELEIEAKSAILIDGKSGKILYGKDSDKPLPPASMTKMMTEYLLLEALDNEKIKFDDIVIASEYAHWLGIDGGSRVFLALGEKRTVEELLYAIAVYSANDATVALAEYLAGSETNFVELMNKKAEELGMTQTLFLTSTGLPADDLGEFAPLIAGEQVMSARDAAILAWHLVNDHPEALKYTSTPFLNFREGEANELKSLPNWNWMLPGVVKAYEYQGVDGLKTGFTDEAGYNFTGTAKKNNIRLISVVMGTTSKEQRFMETKKLLDYGFNNFELINLVKAKDSVLVFEKLEVKKGKETEVAVIAKSDLNILIKKGEKELYQPIIISDESITAPIKSGDKLGIVSYEYKGNETYSYLNDTIKETENVDLLANEDVEEAGFFRLFFRKILEVLKAIFGAITNW